jgi:hypothetical protein
MSSAPQTTYRTRRRRFEAADVLRAIRRWVEQYGAPPTLADWEPSRARSAGHHWRVARFAAGDWPTVRVAKRHFGSLGNAIEAAGYQRPSPGPRRAEFALEADILEAIRRWTKRYGTPPSQADWDPGRARALGQDWRVVRYQTGAWPSAYSVRASYGSLGAGIRAAGLRAPPQRDGINAAVVRNYLNRRRLAILFAREIGEPGPKVIAEQLRAVTAARTAQDDEALAGALTDLAGAALAWADELTGAVPPPSPRGEREGDEENLHDERPKGKPSRDFLL